MDDMTLRATKALEDPEASVESTGLRRKSVPLTDRLRRVLAQGAVVVGLATLSLAATPQAHAQSLLDSLGMQGQQQQQGYSQSQAYTQPSNYGAYSQQQYGQQLQQLVRNEINRHDNLVNTYRAIWGQPMTMDQMQALNSDFDVRISEIQRGDLHGLTPQAYNQIREQQTGQVIQTMQQRHQMAMGQYQQRNQGINLGSILGMR